MSKNNELALRARIVYLGHMRNLVSCKLGLPPKNQHSERSGEIWMKIFTPPPHPFLAKAGSDDY